MQSCDIIIPIWNNLALTKTCIDSICRNTSYPYRLILVDNASNIETKDYLGQLQKACKSGEIILKQNDKNEGYIKAVNAGIALSNAEYVCILNNDTIVTKNWLKEMILLMERHKDIGIVNPSSNTLGQKKPRGVSFESFVKGFEGQSARFAEIGAAIGFCLLARRRLFDEIGLFDEVYGMGNFDDTDLSLRAKEKGYKIVRALASYVYHKEQASFNFLKSFDKDFKRNKKIFEAKWGKTLRAMVIVKKLNQNSLVYLREILKKYAKEKSWVYIICPATNTKEFFEKYSNITFYHYGKAFYLKAFFKLLFKKKRISVLYSDSPNFLKLAWFSCRDIKEKNIIGRSLIK